MGRFVWPVDSGVWFRPSDSVPAYLAFASVKLVVPTREHVVLEGAPLESVHEIIELFVSDSVAKAALA